MTVVAHRPRERAGTDGPGGRRNVVEEIAARRRSDVLAELAGTPGAALVAAARAAPSPRPIAERLAEPGLHLIAEIKRSSPSAGRIAAGGDDLVARARAYEAGGAAAISVLCEPHWFGGSVDDLRAVRAAVAVPVLAKEFVVEEAQLPVLRAAGADLVLLLAVLHPARRLARLVASAMELGMEPLVEVHDQRELERALASGARLIGLNNRDLRTLEVDVERAARLREQVPDDRLVIAESGVREPATVARWRALGFDGALVGEALVRAAQPAAAAAAFVAAGRAPDDLANVARRPLVKICGVTDADGALAAVAAGADAIGLNVAPGTPRELAPRRGRRPGPADPVGCGRRAPPARRGRHRRCLAGPACGDHLRLRSRRRPAQRRRIDRDRKVHRTPDLEGPPPAGGRAGGPVAGRRRDRVARTRLPRRWRRAPPARHRRRATSGRDRNAGRGTSRGGRRPGAAGHPGRRPGSRERRGRHADRAGGRRRCRVRRRASA